MGLDVILEDDFGEELAVHDDEGGVLARSLPAGGAEFPMLRYVDTEGTTSFNRLQLAAVIPELERLKASCPPPAGEAWGRVLALARRAAAEPHLHLRFLGD